MLCQKCGKREANFHYTQMVNNVKAEVRLCSECAEKMGLTKGLSMGFDDDFGFNSLLNSFFSPRGTSSIFNTLESAFNRPRMFKIDGDKIYRNEFESELDKMFTGFGEETVKANGENKEKNEKSDGGKIENLRAGLKKAIEQERFEDAAKIRDEIKEIEKGDNKKEE